MVDELTSSLEFIKYDLKKTMDLLPGIWHVVDINSKYIYYNKAHAKILGAAEFTEAPFRSQASVQFDLHSNQVVCKSKKSVQYIHCIYTNIGEWLIFDVVKYPIFNSNGDVQAIGVRYIDETSGNSLIECLAMLENINLSYNKSTNKSVIIQRHKKKVELKPKEIECLFYLVRGMSLKQISEIQNTSYRAVLWMIQCLKVKFNAATTRNLSVKYLLSGHANKIPNNILTKETFICLTDISVVTEEMVQMFDYNPFNPSLDYAQKTFYQILDTLPGTWAVLDKQSNFIYYNEAYSKMVGVDSMPKDYLIGKNAYAIASKISECAEYFFISDKLLKDTKKKVTILSCLLGPNDKWFICEINKMPILNHKNEVEAILCQYFDKINNYAVDLVLSILQQSNIQPDFADDSCYIYYLMKTSEQIKLKPREIECLFYLNQGYSHKEIAIRRSVPYRTLTYHIDKLKYKFAAVTVKELITKALVSGYVNTIPKNLFNKQIYIIIQQ